MVSRPALDDHLAFAWEAFWALSGDRPSSPGWVGAITFVALDHFAARYGVEDPDDFEALRAQIKAMDRVWREVMIQRMKDDAKSR